MVVKERRTSVQDVSDHRTVGAMMLKSNPDGTDGVQGWRQGILLGKHTPQGQKPSQKCALVNAITADSSWFLMSVSLQMNT